jgi:hypothetical protein
VQALHHGKRSAPRVEAPQYGASEPKELQPEPVCPAPPPRLDELKVLEIAEEPVERASRLSHELGELHDGELLLYKVIEDGGGL